MNERDIPTLRTARQTIVATVSVLFLVTAALLVLHWYQRGLEAGGVRWFHLDKERNIPTWFSGVVLFLLGCAAIAAFHQELRRNSEGKRTFRAPILWLGLAFLGLGMSLDETTILHENLLWREVRQVSGDLEGGWLFLTQWQIVFAPAILLAFGYLVVFFANRFRASRGAVRFAVAAIVCWAGALFLEGMRETCKAAGKAWYSLEVLGEEALEMVGGILLLAAIASYVVDITIDFSAERRARLGLAARFLTRRAMVCLGAVLAVLLGGGLLLYQIAGKQAAAGAPVPKLMRRVIEAQVASAEEMREERVRAIWFEDVAAPLPLAEKDRLALAGWISGSIAGEPESGGGLPAGISEDREARVVFLTLSDGVSAARTFLGTGGGLVAACEEAISSARAGEGALPGTASILIEIVRQVRTTRGASIEAPVVIERGIHGIAFGRASGIAFTPGEVLARTLVNSDLRMRFKNIDRHIRREKPDLERAFVRMQESRSFDVHCFETEGLFFHGRETVPLYRGHRLFDARAIDASELREAARRGGEYLTRAVDRRGRFVYEYLPKTDVAKKGYNILRHAGTVYSMFELYGETGGDELLESAGRALDYLVWGVKPDPAGGGDCACVVESGVIKLGGNALAILALAEHLAATGDRRHVPLMQRLGRWILRVQSEEGEFTVHKLGYEDGRPRDFVSGYYPGEALFALTRLHAVDGDPAWLDAAESGALYLILVRDAELQDSELAHDHWLLYALEQLYRYRPERIYVEHAARIAGAIVASQNRNPGFRDWLGSYYQPPRSTPTATRCEGLIAAYRMIREDGDPVLAGRILEAIRLGAAFQLQTQFRPESVLYLDDPQRALGGFHRSLTDYSIRIDYVQHNISALLGLAKS